MAHPNEELSLHLHVEEGQAASSEQPVSRIWLWHRLVLVGLMLIGVVAWRTVARNGLTDSSAAASAHIGELAFNPMLPAFGPGKLRTMKQVPMGHRISEAHPTRRDILCPQVHADLAGINDVFTRIACIVGLAAGYDFLSKRISASPALPEPNYTFSYGADPENVGDLYLPPSRAALSPVVVLVHGGFWQDQYKRDLMAPLAVDLCRNNVAVWNLEYRRVGSGGGFPSTLIDVAAGIDWLATNADEYGLDLGRLAVVGHSAGAQLAMWAFQRRALPRSAGGTGMDSEEGAGVAEVIAHALPSKLAHQNHSLKPRIVVSAGGVLDLSYALSDPRQQNGGRVAVSSLLGPSGFSPAQLMKFTSPIDMLPPEKSSSDDIGLAQVGLLHGLQDENVPVEHSIRFAAAAEKADLPYAYRPVQGAGHFEVLDPTSSSWGAVRSMLREAGVLQDTA